MCIKVCLGNFSFTAREKENKSGKELDLTLLKIGGTFLISINSSESSNKMSTPSIPTPSHITDWKEAKYSLGMIKRAAIRPVAINTIKYFTLNLRCQAKNKSGATRLKSKIEPTTTPVRSAGNDWSPKEEWYNT